MQIAKNKTMATTIALFLVLTIAITLVALPTSYAHTPPWSINTYCFINASPNPAAVGQVLYVNAWINWVPPTVNNIYGDRWYFTLNITDPNGHIETFNLKSDNAGATYTSFTPTVAGNYTLEVTFLEQKLMGLNQPPGSGPSTNAYINDTFKSSSASMHLTVQNEPIPNYPNTPLPSGYWQRPINAMNTEWYSIGGSWLGLGIKLDFGSTGMYDQNGGFNPYSQAPNTAHILWTKPVAFGGQVGGPQGGTEDTVFYAGLQYEPKFSPIIMSGVLYYVNLPSSSNIQGWTAVNIRTGEVLWTKNTTEALRCGQEFHFVTPNQYGTTDYLWATSGSSLIMCDAYTGNDILTIENATSGVAYFSLFQDTGGNLIGYYFNLTTSTLNMWNSTLNILGPTVTTQSWSWRPAQGARYDFRRGIQWTVPIPNASQVGLSFVPGFGGLNILGIDYSDGVIVCTSCSVGTWQSSTLEMGFSTKDGSLLWGPINRTQQPYTMQVMGPAADGIYTEFTKEARSWSGYSVFTGAQVWGPTTSYNDSFGYYNQRSATYAYGDLIAWSLGGSVRSFSMTNGTANWVFETGNTGTETVYGSWPLWIINNYEASVADGKIFVEGGHAYNPPMFKGARLYAINATNGNLVWSILGFFCSSPIPISDGVLLGLNSYDGQIYAFGKGLTATTISAPLTAMSLGQSLVITGTVTDQSPGQTCLGIPAKGTAAVSDDSMSAWMEYLYEQQPIPTNATGVPVSLDVIDANGNFRNIGTATTDLTGSYSFMWKPDIPGKYTVIATFAGSGSYFGSYAETAFGVEEAATATPPPQYPVPIDYTSTIIAATVVLLIAIAIVGILLLRKK